MAKIAAIILAAGKSSRFGKPKQLLQLKHKSLVCRIFDEARTAACSTIIVVTGNAHDEVKNRFAGEDVIISRNENWQRGIGTSIRAGVQSLIEAAPQTHAVVLLACDQPLVDAKTIRDLITLRDETQKPIVASRYSNTLGVPALFDRTCFDQLVALDGDSGAKAIILANKERVAALEFPDGAIDVDTIQDWEGFRGRVRG